LKLIFDEEILDKLYFGDQDLINQMFKLFLDQLIESKSIILSGYDQKDFEMLKGIFHKMRPSFKMVGLVEVFEQFEVHERKMKDQNLAYLEANYNEILTTIDKAYEFIEKRLQGN